MIWLKIMPGPGNSKMRQVVPDEPTSVLTGSIVSKIMDPLDFDTFGREVIQIQMHEIVNSPPAVVEVQCYVKYFLLYYYFSETRAQEKTTEGCKIT